MFYKEIQEGRSFILRFDHREDILKGLHTFFHQQKLKGAVFWILGALEKGKLVCGPEQTSLPPEPMFFSFDEPREIFGWGNISCQANGIPKIHFHLSAGRKEHSYTGCLREEGKVFLTCEAYIKEIINFPVRKKDADSGIDLLDIQEQRDS